MSDRVELPDIMDGKRIMLMRIKNEISVWKEAEPYEGQPTYTTPLAFHVESARSFAKAMLALADQPALDE